MFAGVYREDRVVIVNDTTTLTCEKFPNVVWHFNASSHPLEKDTVYSAGNIKREFDDSIFIVNNTIEITRTRLKHAGVYECYRNFRDTDEVQLTVLGEFGFYLEQVDYKHFHHIIGGNVQLTVFSL